MGRSEGRKICPGEEIEGFRKGRVQERESTWASEGGKSKKRKGKFALGRKLNGSERRESKRGSQLGLLKGESIREGKSALERKLC